MEGGVGGEPGRGRDPTDRPMWSPVDRGRPRRRHEERAAEKGWLGCLLATVTTYEGADWI